MSSFDEFMQLVRQGDKSITKETVDTEYFNATDEFGLRPIHWASLNGRVDILKWLLKNKSDIETEDQHGWRPIHFGCIRNHKEITKLLVEHFCNIECKTKNNETPLDIIMGNCDHTFIDNFEDNLKETTNKKIGLTMGLSCSLKCNHKFCLTSVTAVNFDKGIYISNGGFGKVYRTQDTIFSRQYVLKINKKKTEELEQKSLEFKIEHNINEIRHLLNHPRIIKYYGGILRKEKWLIFEEYLNGGSLESELRKLKDSNTGLPPPAIAQRCKDIIEGIIYLHQNKIIHRNLKPAKVILDKNSRCKLILSSLSRFLRPTDLDNTDGLLRTFCGTPYYMAPEIINDEAYSFPIDIWAIGATIIHMVQGLRPYFAMNTNAVIFKIGMTRKIEYIRPNGFTKELENFISAILNPSAKERPTAEELLNFDFMKNVIENKEMENRYKPYEEVFKENQESCMDIIKLAIENKKIAAEIGLKCVSNCDHGFCLSSVSVNNFQKGDLIGRGFYGNVYKVKESQTNRELAVKTFNFGTKPEILKEAKILQDKLNMFRTSIHHERLVQYYGAIRKSHKLYIFREYVEGKSIKEEIFRNSNTSSTFIEESLAKRYTIHILEALEFLHQLNIIHKNVKIGNIFITVDGNAKLADYGFCEILKLLTTDRERTFYGAAFYIAPEIHKEESFDNSVDIWSLGVAVHEMLTGRPPFLDFQEKSIKYKFGFPRMPGANINPPEISEEWKAFIDTMMKEIPRERANAKTLLQSEFLNKMKI